MAVLPLPDVFLKRAKAPLAVFCSPRQFPCSAPAPVAVLNLPVMLVVSARAPVAVLPLPVVLFTSASSPRNVLLRASQPSWQTARACGESAKQPSVSAMRTGRIVVFLD